MTTLDLPHAADAPIGVFDSGVGGLSVLRHIHARLPRERLLYFSDAGFAPYGGKPEEVIVARSLAIAGFLVAQGVKALVVACNTATAAAIGAVREAWPALPVVGVEPGLKPAVAATRSGVVGVLATEGTLASARFELLRGQLAAATGVRFLKQPCPGLADQVEKGELRSAGTAALLSGYLAPLLEQGADTLVLGCTHYPFLQPLVEDIVKRTTSRPVAIVDTGDPVARQLERRLKDLQLLRTGESDASMAAFTTGSASSLARAFAVLLKRDPQITVVQANG